MNIHIVEHSILNGIEYCTFWFRSVVEMTRHQLLLHRAQSRDTAGPRARARIGAERETDTNSEATTTV
jgi:hypothetical protein